MDVIIPERKLFAIDAMDEALEMVRTCSFALQLPDGDLDGPAVESITHTLNAALAMLNRIREVLNEAHGAGLKLPKKGGGNV